MTYRDEKDIGPTTEEIATANGPFGLIVILIVLVVVAPATLAQWVFS